jgi:hypothetical protein
MISMTRKAIVPIILILSTLLQPSGLLAERSTRTLPAEVLWITDGDTIVVHLQGHKEAATERKMKDYSDQWG